MYFRYWCVEEGAGTDDDEMGVSKTEGSDDVADYDSDNSHAEDDDNDNDNNDW